MTERHVVYLTVAGTLLFVVLVLFIALLLYRYFQRQQLQLLQEARLLAQHERELLDVRLQEQERAMNRISAEIHDNIGQQLDMLEMNTKAMREAGLPERFHRLLDANQTLSRRLAAELRNISYGLNSVYLRQYGLWEVLQRELNHINSARRLACSLEISGEYRSLPDEKELLVYRIFQEGVHNVLKHAQAGKLDVQLHYSDTGFSMELTDDGIGFDETASSFTSGLGIRNMQHRARLAGAMLSIGSGTKKGTRITLQLELPENDAGC